MHRGLRLRAAGILFVVSHCYTSNFTLECEGVQHCFERQRNIKHHFSKSWAAELTVGYMEIRIQLDTETCLLLFWKSTRNLNQMWRSRFNFFHLVCTTSAMSSESHSSHGYLSSCLLRDTMRLADYPSKESYWMIPKLRVVSRTNANLKRQYPIN
jgi:hypothetical protein